MTRGGSATYVYCAVQARGWPIPARAPRGLTGMGAPRALDTGHGLWLIVADAPLSRYGAAPVEARLADLNWVLRCAVAHEAVVEHVARAGTVVPMKLFTLFSSDERALAHVARTREKIDRLLKHVTGRDEWGVRLSLDERLAVRRLAAGRRDTRRPVSGTRFLLGKKAEKDRRRRLAADAVREAERVFDDLASRAADSRRRTPEQGTAPVRILLDAAFLVPAKRARRFRAAVGVLARRLTGHGYELTLTGPWPPYNFVSETA